MGTLSVNQNKLQKRLRRLAGEAITDFNMIEDGDKVMVCLSGGKDSYTMLDILLYLQKTFFLNMFYGGTLKAMPPKLLADDGRNVVIRPLAYCSEKDIEAYSQLKEFPIIPCNLCGSQENLQRQVVKEMLLEWERKSPGRTEIMFRALQNVVPSQLADRNLFDFANLRIDENATPRFLDVMNL